MTKEEFIKYINYLKLIFNQDIPNDRVFVETWYKPFSKINKKIAQDMAEAYVKEETGKFKFSKLLSYKDMILKKQEYIEPKVFCNCKICGGLGLVFVEKYYYDKSRHLLTNRIYETTYRCKCSAGDQQASYIKMITEEIMNDHFKDYDGVFRLTPREKDNINYADIESIKKTVNKRKEEMKNEA